MAFGDKFSNEQREVDACADTLGIHVAAKSATKLKRILVVDDGAGIVAQLRLQFDFISDDLSCYQLERFTNPQEALELANRRSFDLVVCDYSMPAMDGIAFLNALAQVHPPCPGIVLGGLSDTDAMVRMGNGEDVHRIVQKPWRQNELKKLLADVIRLAVPVAGFRKRTLPKPTITTLRTAPLLAELPPAWLERLAGMADWQVHHPDDILIRQNELSKSVYFVISGYLKVIRGGALAHRSGNEGYPDRRVRKRGQVMLALLGPGDMVGEIGPLLQIERPASVVALTPCQVIRIPGQEFLASIQQHPNFALAVTRKIALRLLGANHQQELMRGDLEGRIHALIRQCKAIGLDTGRWLTNAEIARMLGATRVAVSQIMGRINRNARDSESL